MFFHRIHIFRSCGQDLVRWNTLLFSARDQLCASLFLGHATQQGNDHAPNIVSSSTLSILQYDHIIAVEQYIPARKGSWNYGIARSTHYYWTCSANYIYVGASGTCFTLPATSVPIIKSDSWNFEISTATPLEIIAGNNVECPCLHKTHRAKYPFCSMRHLWCVS